MDAYGSESVVFWLPRFITQFWSVMSLFMLHALNALFQDGNEKFCFTAKRQIVGFGSLYFFLLSTSSFSFWTFVMKRILFSVFEREVILWDCNLKFESNQREVSFYLVRNSPLREKRLIFFLTLLHWRSTLSRSVHLESISKYVLKQTKH
jgi:hypothetical protein